MSNLHKQLAQAEERYERAEASALDYYDRHSSAVALVAGKWGYAEAVFVCTDQSTTVAGAQCLREALETEDPTDASAILTHIIRDAGECSSEPYFVVGRMPQVSSMVVLDVEAQTVTGYRPLESSEPVAIWPVDQFKRQDYERGDEEGYRRSVHRDRAIYDLLEPGYRAVAEENETAEAELFRLRAADRAQTARLFGLQTD